MLKPIPRIIKASPQLNRDVQGINSDVPFGLAQFAAPNPNFAEQPLVKLKRKGIAQIRRAFAGVQASQGLQ